MIMIPERTEPVTRLRRNVLIDAASLEKFCRGVNLLKRDFSAGVTTNALGLAGMDLPVSAYDQFVIWHYVAMNTLTPSPPAPNPNARNAAHRGSVFLPREVTVRAVRGRRLYGVRRSADGVPEIVVYQTSAQAAGGNG